MQTQPLAVNNNAQLPHVVASESTTPHRAALAQQRSMLARWQHAVQRRMVLALSGNAGMSTTEYAIGTLSAAAFAALLYVIVSGDTVSGALEDLFERALSTRVG